MENKEIKANMRVLAAILTEGAFAIYNYLKCNSQLVHKYKLKIEECLRTCCLLKGNSYLHGDQTILLDYCGTGQTVLLWLFGGDEGAYILDFVQKSYLPF